MPAQVLMRVTDTQLGDMPVTSNGRDVGEGEAIVEKVLAKTARLALNINSF